MKDTEGPSNMDSNSHNRTFSAIRKIEVTPMHSEVRLLPPSSNCDQPLNLGNSFDRRLDVPAVQLSRSKQIDVEVHNLLRMKSIRRINTPMVVLPVGVKSESTLI